MDEQLWRKEDTEDDTVQIRHRTQDHGGFRRLGGETAYDTPPLTNND